jgi:outer membrane protein assembly factor BamB
VSRICPSAPLWAAALILLASVPLCAEESTWPQFRGPGALGIARGTASLPVHFGPEKNVVWKTALPPGLSSPCVWGRRIFVTGHDAAGKKLETLCLDRDKGGVVWRRSIPVERLEKLNRTNSPAAGTPACDGERVVVYSGSFGLVCYDLEGKEVWKLPLPAPQTMFGSGTSPVVAGGVVLLKCQGKAAALLALDARTGEPRWKKEKLPYDPAYSLPVVRPVGKGHEVIVHGERGIKGYDLADGKERWSIGGLFCAAIPTPVLADGLAYFVSVYPGGDKDDRFQLPTFDELLKKHDKDKDGKLSREEIKGVVIYSRDEKSKDGDITLSSLFGAIDRDGDGKLSRFEWGFAKMFLGGWTNSLLAVQLIEEGETVRTKVVWREANSLPEVASPLCYEGRLYLVKHGGLLTCLDAKTGKLLHRGRVGATGLCYASPVGGDGKVYVATMQGKVIVLKAGDRPEVLARNDMGEPIAATPALLDGVLYLRTQKHLYAIRE